MNDFFCPLPWNSTSIRNDGVLRVCCNSNQGPNRGELDWDVDDVDGSRNSPRLKDMRVKILSGEYPDDCVRCKREANSGIRTRFIYESETWNDVLNKEIAKSKTKEDGEISENDFPLTYYDIRFGTFCNVMCRYCSPYSSSALGVLPGDYKWFERESFWEHLKNNIQNVQVFHIEGGEPLLIPEYYRFMKMAVETDTAKNIKIESTTNLTKIPNKAWDLWKEFKEVRLGVSVDTVGDSFYYIRYPSTWQQVSENIKRIDKAEGNFALWFATSISTLNIWYLPDLVKWKIKQQFKRFNNGTTRPFFSDHPIHAPKYYNIKCLPQMVKCDVTDHLLSSIKEVDQVADEFESSDKMRDVYKISVRNLFDSYISFMNQEDLSNPWYSKFLSHTKRLDVERGQKMRDYMPEWYEILRGET